MRVRNKNADKEKTEKRTGNKADRKMAMLAVLAVVVVGICGGVAFAKYYDAKYRPGVSVASGLYFNSNKLLKNPGQTKDIMKIDTDNMMVNVNSDKWSSGNLYFDVEIQNYDNNLLYNDENLNVSYEICFTLLETPAGADYYVQDVDGTEHTLAKGKVVKLNQGYLAGGTRNQDTYRIRINLRDVAAYNGARVLAVAYPTSPDYLYDEEEQQNRLTGIFQGVYSENEMRVENAFFLVEEDADYNELTWKDKVTDLSGLIFNIKTIGSIVTDDNNAAKQEAIVRWRSDYISISQYDACYIEAQEKQASKSPSEEDYIWTAADTEGKQWTYMRIEVLPYTNVNITFYKTEKFLEEFKKDMIDRAMFEGMAEAYTEES